MKNCKIFVGILLVIALLTIEYSSIQYYGKIRDGDIETVATVANHRGKKNKKVYLTFDDGPSLLTDDYLNVLKKHDAKATFFLIGQQIEGDMKKVVEREIQEGHEIGVHTYSHKSGEIYESADSYYNDVKQVQKILLDEFQYDSRIWRFPWGSSNCYIGGFKNEIVGRLQKEEMDYVDWNVSAEDSVGKPSVASIIENVKKDCFGVEEPVVLMHDSSCNQMTLEALEEVILLFENEGYEFATISERKEKCQFGN